MNDFLNELLERFRVPTNEHDVAKSKAEMWHPAATIACNVLWCTTIIAVIWIIAHAK